MPEKSLKDLYGRLVQMEKQINDRLDAQSRRIAQLEFVRAEEDPDDDPAQTKKIKKGGEVDQDVDWLWCPGCGLKLELDCDNKDHHIDTMLSTIRIECEDEAGWGEYVIVYKLR